jgi:hypothetical protein
MRSVSLRSCAISLRSVIPLFAETPSHPFVPLDGRSAGARSEGQGRSKIGASRIPLTAASTLAGWCRSGEGAPVRMAVILLSGLLYGVAIPAIALAQTKPVARPSARDLYGDHIAEAAQRFELPAAWILAVLRAESDGDPRATSPKGAIGLMQIMPETWAELRARYRLGDDPYDPHDNIVAGAAYIRELFDRYGSPGTGGRPPAIARLEFLRSRVDELETVVAAIARNPRRMLAAEDSLLPYHRANRVTGPEILRSFRSGRILRETTLPSRLPAPLNGFLPERIRVRRRCSSLDLPEHRQMSACLRSWSAWLGVAAELLERLGPEEGDGHRTGALAWASRCRRLSRRIGSLNAAAPFAEAGEGQPRLVLSALFRNDPSYRRFYKLWQDMNLGIAAVFGEFLNLPLARTFELYELWCFLRLVRAGAEEFGPAGLDVRDLFISDAGGGVTFAAGAVTVPVGSGWKLCFQKQYREFWNEAERRGSYSRTMTPDIVSAHHPPEAGERSKMIVLDAKYRIDDGLNDALSSIHTYRDALVQETETGAIEGIVTAAYLLTPYLPTPAKASYRDTVMPGRLFHPGYRAGFHFGAVTLRPGMTAAEIAGALRLIVEDATAT